MTCTPPRSLFRSVLAVTLVSALAAGSAAMALDDIVATFHCGDLGAVEAHFGAADVALALPDGQTLLLPQLPSGSGARYGDGATEFWNHGDEASLELAGTQYACQVSSDSLLLPESAGGTGALAETITFPRQTVA